MGDRLIAVLLHRTARKRDKYTCAEWDFNPLSKWYSTWGTRTPGDTRKLLTRYVKLGGKYLLIHYFGYNLFNLFYMWIKTVCILNYTQTTLGGTKLKINYIWGYANKNDKNDFQGSS
jgi:hypothetical protein